MNAILSLPGFLDGRAVCAGPGADPDTWHSIDPATQARARAICRTCPLLTACRAYALTDPDLTGTWGGLTRADRNHLISPPATPRRAPCGTQQAYRRHCAAREHCSLCWEAEDDRRRERWTAALEVEHAVGGTLKGMRLEQRLGLEPCERCREAERAYRRARQAAKRLAAPPEAQESPVSLPARPAPTQAAA
ncbi:WhiB family transcriptional regulator [Streptomyces buecherae]|uniref:WhiB family transcriptional regulator n=1 Tax=Streptomyces buecherae TaxID=2763006 RepID=UPI0033D281A7